MKNEQFIQKHVKYILLFFLLGMPSKVVAEVYSHFKINGIESSTMAAGASSDWEVFFTRGQNPQPIKKFMIMHEKPMHMVIIKNDLSHFAHVHPHLNKENGIFNLKMNVADSDPDNFDVPRAVPTAGEYLVVSEVMPMGTEFMKIDRFPLSVTGQAVPLETPPEAKKLPMTEYFNENGEPAGEGAWYRLRFNLQQFEWCGWWLPKFYMLVEVKNDHGYAPVENLEKWLGMGGHAVLASYAGQADKTFYHLHAFLPNSEPGEFIFPYDDHKKPLPEGMYKIWFQFKHQSRVFTVPYSFQYSWPKKQARDLCVQ